MARILVAANSIWNIGHFRAGLIRSLIKAGHQIITVAPEAAGIQVGGVPIKHRPCRMDRSGTNPVKDLACLRDLARIVREERPDIFLSFTIKPNIYGSFVCALLKVPAVPNVSGLGTAFLGSSVFRRAVSLMYRVAFARAKAVFFQNPDDRDLFVSLKIVKPAQAVVLPGSGIDLSSFAPASVPRELRFLMIARLLGDKGVREYVEAARKLRAALPTAIFSLLGELDRGNPTAVGEDELEEWIAEGAIEYLGSTPDVRQFIASSTALVLPSYREGLPRTLLEGAAMGRPLIGTDVPGCRQVVRDGVTGFLCRARSADSLAEAMLRLAVRSHDERVAMGASARKMAEDEFDEALVVRFYLDAITRPD
jgi:glycosyltransferase involved in cell wall biosynthesis